MKMKLPRNKAIFLAHSLLFAFYSLSFAKSACAQTVESFTVAPARQELTVDPGESTAVTIKFFNRGETPASGLLKVADFIVEDKEGSPTILEGPSQISPRFAAASWVQLPYDRMTIAAEEKVTVQTKINVPSDARPGGRYIAIYFEPGAVIPAGEQDKQIAISPRIAGLVSLRVSGPITEKTDLIRFEAPKLSQYGPVMITSEIENQGDYHVRPKGTITIYDTFGKATERSLLDEENIFPDASRIYENEVGKQWMFGKYKAELAASYGETGKSVSGLIYFWVVPWMLIAVILLLIIIVVLILTIILRHIKRRQTELESKLKADEQKIQVLEKKLEEKK